MHGQTKIKLYDCWQGNTEGSERETATVLGPRGPLRISHEIKWD